MLSMTRITSKFFLFRAAAHRTLTILNIGLILIQLTDNLVIVAFLADGHAGGSGGLST
jgi:hypothetical protein